MRRGCVRSGRIVAEFTRTVTGEHERQHHAPARARAGGRRGLQLWVGRRVRAVAGETGLSATSTASEVDSRPFTSLCGGLGLPHLRQGEGAFRQAWVTEADLDFGDAVSPDARTNGERQLAEDELEISDLQPFRRQGDLAMGCQGGRPQLGSESLPGF